MSKKKSSTDKMNGAFLPCDMKSTKNKIIYGSLSVWMLLYIAIVLIPVFWMLLFVFKEPSEIISKTPTFFPKQIRLSKIGEVWSQYRIYRYYVNTAVMAVGTVIFDVVINGLAGYVISKLKPKGSKAYFSLIFTLMLIPATVSMVPNYMLFKDFPYLHINMLNSFVPIWLMAGANMFNVLLFKTSFDGISDSLIEAAKLDGASNLKIFLKIIIPLSVPVIITVSIFTFNAQFGNFFWPYLLIDDPNKTVLGVRLYKLKSSNLSLDVQMMTLIFSVVPQALVFILFQKYIVGGINIGGVKG